MFSLTEVEMMFIPIITAIVNVLKEAGLKSRFASLVSLTLGIIFCFVFSSEVLYGQKFLKGLVIGLSASGFYTNGKNFIGTLRPKGKDNK